MTNGPMASLQFLGAAGGVTGSKFLFSYGDDQLLIDCGLFQGLKELRQEIGPRCRLISTVCAR
jgi:Cft2 family RNA processing exonuclease